MAELALPAAMWALQAVELQAAAPALRLLRCPATAALQALELRRAPGLARGPPVRLRPLAHFRLDLTLPKTPTFLKCPVPKK